jgi:AcrR family transcriptional regulator
MSMEEGLIHRKDSVILTAIEIIDELGIQGLSSREIAKRQGISEGTLFRHFKNKNEILIAVLDNFSKFDSDIFNSIIIRKLGFEDSITFFISSYVEYYENYPQITSLVNAYEVFRWEPELEEKISKIIERRFKFVKGLIDEGKKNGKILNNTESEILSEIIISVLNGTILRWRMSHYSFLLKERALSSLDMLIKVFLNK